MPFDHIKIIFLDDGGVMNNNDLRAPQWRELVAQYFSPQYGGSIDAWKSANEFVFSQMFEQYEQVVKESPDIKFNDWWRETEIQWLTGMFQFIDITPPPYDQQARIAREASVWITSRVKAAYPRVIETIRELYNKGFTLCTASGEVSWELKGYLTGMGVNDCFERFFGCDLIDTIKGSPVYYKKIFKDMKIHDPDQVVVVDDSIKPLTWASEVGANIVHILNSNTCKNSKCHHIRQLKDLPQLFE